MPECPCGSGTGYADCCQPLIDGVLKAETAEALMRARYTAFVKGAVDFIQETLHPDMHGQFKRDAVTAWSRKSEWQGLEILQVANGQNGDDTGTVEFVAKYRDKGKPVRHHEIAEFKRFEGEWHFYDGTAPKPTQVVRQEPKIGRNDPCRCGSGKKFKKCCGV